MDRLSEPSPTPARESAKDRRMWWMVFAGYALFVVAQASFQFFVNSDNWRTAGIAGSDGQAYYAYVRSLVIDGDLDFENELYDFNYNKHGFQTRDALPRSPVVASKGRSELGRIFNRYGIGFSLLYLPYFLVAHLLALVLPGVAADGYSLPYQSMAPVGTISYGLAALWTMRRIMLRYARPAAATMAAVVLFLAFQGAYPMIQFWCNPHLQSLLVFNAMVLVGFRVWDGSASASLRRDKWGAWAALGTLTGLAGLLHTEQLAFGLFPAALAVAMARRETRDIGAAAAIRRFALRGGAALIVCGAVFFVQLAAWRVMWGAWFRASMNNPGEGFDWASPVLLKVLFSTRHGLFYWSPVLLVGAAGLVWLIARRRAGTALLCALPVLVVLYYVYASWRIWWMGYSFGARQFIVLTAFFGVGLAWVFERLWERKALVWGVSAVLVCWNQVMLWLFLNGHIPRSEGFAPWLPLVRFWELVMRKMGF